MPDDTTLAHVGKEGRIITGCSHAGVCNIIAQAKRVTGEMRIHSILGGFHLMERRLNNCGVQRTFSRKTAE